MKKSISILFFLLMGIVFLFLSCSSAGHVTGEDYVKILSVEPNSNLTETPTEFTIEVEYNLVSEVKVSILVGFNNGSDPNKNVMGNSYKIKWRGLGNHTFRISTTPKNWGEEADFNVRVQFFEISNNFPLPIPMLGISDEWVLSFGD